MIAGLRQSAARLTCHAGLLDARDPRRQPRARCAAAAGHRADLRHEHLRRVRRDRARRAARVRPPRPLLHALLQPDPRGARAAVAELESGEAALATASGMAAIHAAALSHLRTGDELLLPNALYGGTLALARTVLARSGITHRAVDTTDADAVAAAITPRTRVLWLETISNPTTAMADIEVLSELAHERDVAVVVDSSFTSPALANPARAGSRSRGAFDDQVHRWPLGSHRRHPRRQLERVAAAREIVVNAGGSASPWEAFLVLRGLKTLGLRMERHSANALAVAACARGSSRSRGCSLPGTRPAIRSTIWRAHAARRGGGRHARPRSRRWPRPRRAVPRPGRGGRPRHEPRQRRDARQPSRVVEPPAAR